jgi:hypothetical protein
VSAVAALTLTSAPRATRATLIEAVVATVGDRVIMLSDARLLRDLGVIPPGTGREDALRQLVDRALMLGEVERFQSPAPSATIVDARIADLRARAGPEGWDAMLRRNGADEERVRAVVEDSQRLETYLEQRFGALAEPSDEDLRQAYDARRQAAPGDRLPAFEAMRESLHAELAAARFRTLVDQWIAELRQRGDVSIRGLPEDTGQ